MIPFSTDFVVSFDSLRTTKGTMKPINLIKPGNWILTCYYGQLQLNVKTAIKKESNLEVELQLIFAPNDGVNPDFLSVSILTLPNDKTNVVDSSPDTRLELSGKREYVNMSSEEIANWSLLYNHKSQRFSTWVVRATFDMLFQDIDNGLVEMNIGVVVKKGFMKKLIDPITSFFWRPIQFCHRDVAMEALGAV